MAIGHPKVGKTHWALSAPGPIGMINFDYGYEWVADKFLEDKEIEIASYMPARNQAEAKKMLPKIYDDIEESLNTHRTLVIDMAHSWWETERLAEFGKLEQIPPMRYSKLNGAFRYRLLEMFSANDSCHVIMINPMKKEYKGEIKYKNGEPREISVWTGDYMIDGFKQMPSICQLVVSPNYPDNEIHVNLSRIDEDFSGQTLEYDDFPGLLATITGGTREQWDV
jgi:hypothetical protein